jgi:hypothetical protein
MDDDLGLRILVQRIALDELNAASAALRASAQQVISVTREILAGSICGERLSVVSDPHRVPGYPFNGQRRQMALERWRRVHDGTAR